jgi:hypothetical protein
MSWPSESASVRDELRVELRVELGDRKRLELEKKRGARERLERETATPPPLFRSSLYLAAAVSLLQLSLTG